jgi:hypothetical protein
MIIIKIDNFDIEAEKEIATLLFNMEMGKKSFNIMGDIDNPDEDFHVLHKNGISYTIYGSVGSLILLKQNKTDDPYFESFIHNMVNHLSDLDDKYNKNCGIINHYTGGSTDYSLNSKPFTSTTRRIITSTHNQIQQKEETYRWTVIDYIEDGYKKSTRDIWEYTKLREYNTLIIDTNNIFNTDCKITFIDSIKTENYVMSKNFIDYKFTYNAENKNIDEMLRYLRNDRNLIDLEYTLDLLMFTPIYVEEWKNIKPMQGITNREIPPCAYIYDMLYTEYHTPSELEEKIDDVCDSCDMYLYGDIYVLEKGNNHACVCAFCMQYESIYTYIFGRNKRDPDIHLLRVTHPNTAIDIINKFDVPDDVRSVMIELSGDRVSVENGVISTPNYEGYGVKDDVLLKLVVPSENKKLFACDIIY